MKKIIYTLTLALMSHIGYAQQGFHKLGVAAELGLPMGDFGDAYGVGFGGTAKAFYGITEKADITGTVGYLHYGIKGSNDYMSGSMGMIPIMFGYRHDFGGFYGEPQLGLAILRSSVKMDLGGLGSLLGDIGGSSSATKVSFGLGGGYAFGNWDLGARFQITDSMNFLGLRIGYNFAL